MIAPRGFPSRTTALRRGPSRRAAEEYGRPDKYYGYLKGYIILENNPFPSPRPMANRREKIFHLSLFSTLHTHKPYKAPDRGEEEELMTEPPRGTYRPHKSFQERREEEERRRFPWRHKPQAVRRFYGRDHLWRAYVDSSLPWVEEQPGGIVLVDVEGAAAQGVRIVDMGNGVIRMEE